MQRAGEGEAHADYKTAICTTRMWGLIMQHGCHGRFVILPFAVATLKHG